MSQLNLQECNLCCLLLFRMKKIYAILMESTLTVSNNLELRCPRKIRLNIPNKIIQKIAKLQQIFIFLWTR
ncbi:hypothetical protein pb186bvf_020690 [Paramecium bursaria]